MVDESLYIHEAVAAIILTAFIVILMTILFQFSGLDDIVGTLMVELSGETPDTEQVDINKTKSIRNEYSY